MPEGRLQDEAQHHERKEPAAQHREEGEDYVAVATFRNAEGGRDRCDLQRRSFDVHRFQYRPFQSP